MSITSFLKQLRHRRLESRIEKLESELGFNNSYCEEIDSNQWIPYFSTLYDGRVSIIISKGFAGLTPGYTVNHPNFIEAFLGITFEQKINKTYKKAQSRCNELNLQTAYTNNILNRGIL